MNGYNFLELGNETNDLARCYGINNNSVTVGGLVLDNPDGSVNNPCLWPAALGLNQSPQILPMPNGWEEWLLKIADTGHAVGYYQYVMQYAGAVKGVIQICDLLQILSAGGVTGMDQVTATDISKSSFVVGVANNTLTGAWKSFILNYGTNNVTILDPLPGHQQVNPLGVNDAGDIVGNSDSDGFYLPTGGTMKGVANCCLNDINNKLLAVGFTPGYSANEEINPYVPFPTQVNPIWIDFKPGEPGTPQPITLPPPYQYGVATAVNNNGTIVGICWDEKFGHVSGFFCDWVSNSAVLANDLTPLINDNIQSNTADTPIWLITSIYDVNDNGQIVGQAISIYQPPSGYEGRETAFILTPDAKASQSRIPVKIPVGALRNFLNRYPRPSGLRKPKK